MRALLSALAATFAAATSAMAATPPTTPEGWQAAAAQDLSAFHDILRDSSPFPVVERDSAPFRSWLEEGLREARADLPKVKDGRGYYYVVQGYVGGFRDSHIGFGPNRDSKISLRAFSWPGFVLGARSGGGYRVAFRAPDAPDAPPQGAELLGCDGKEVQARVDQHDRYDGNFRLASVRESRAISLLLERGNPFIRHPDACAFKVDGKARDYPLKWRDLDAAHTKQIDEALADNKNPKLGLEPWGEHRWWITIPSMGSDQDWTGFYAGVTAHLDAIRASDAVVIDVRGTGGGDSSFGDRLARLLWGEPFVDAHTPDLGPTIWRVSKLNRDSWARLLDEVAKDPQYPEENKAEFRSILKRYDDALAKGQAAFELGDGPPKRPAAGPNLMHGRVVILTDSACNSACLDLMDELTAMPGVIQAGSTTSADTIFMELTRVPELPSGRAGFGFGHKAWVKRPRGSNQPYTPSARFTWTGEKRDTAAMKAWLEKALAGR